MALFCRSWTVSERVPTSLGGQRCAQRWKSPITGVQLGKLSALPTTSPNLAGYFPAAQLALSASPATPRPFKSP